MPNVENVIIIGSGPAAHTAAIYTARARLDPLMFEGFLAGGVAAGGQLTTTTEVENYPGYQHISGPELMNKMREQSLKCGARIETRTVDKVDLKTRPFKVFVGNATFFTQVIIVATGATAKRLHIPGEFLSRSLNEGFSGGEKKKMEILQLSMLPAKCLVIDEIDSGLDIDALKLVARQISGLQKRGVSLILITHYNRIWRWIHADRVHIMHKGRIVKSGTEQLAKTIEKKGYGEYIGP